VLYDFQNLAPTLEPLWFTTEPRPHNAVWFDSWLGWLTGIGCFVAWCYIMIPKLCTLRRGWYKGWLYVHASTWRSPELKRMLLLAIVGSVAISYVYWQGGIHWHALITSLIGMAFGGGLIWAVRIAGFIALRKEAMGFGDVTLMCMIGAFLGWQASIIVFFLAPFCAVIIALTQFLLTRRRDIAFGPYLCGGALALILYWPWLWDNYGAGVFSLGKVVPLLLLCGLMVMMSLLWLWRLFEQMLFGERNE
jgi:leader peptidase (prepilin peptidase) / N-methyltransferase